MKTKTELIFDEHFVELREIAQNRGWILVQKDKLEFVLILPARDGSRFGLYVNCKNFPENPPIWRWCNPETHIVNQPSDTPRGSNGYFHESGRICAPWNRSAYKQEDPQGPHADWQLQNWSTNSNTGECLTLSAMALRLFVELSSERYLGRQE